MDARRKQLINDYKERKPARGAYAIRCLATGEVWVGTSPNLAAARNGLWFGLRLGSCRDQPLQAAWQAHGEPAFQFEILEELDEDVNPISVRDLLKDLKTRWAAQCGARTLL
jgi:hypothetical protein